MSSSAIAAQISVCRSKITECENEIQRLKKEIEELEYAIARGDTIKLNFEEDLTARVARLNTTEDLQKYAVTGNRYVPNMNDDLTGQKMKSIIESIEEKRDILKREIMNCYNLLEEEENRLRNLHNELADLENRYQAALRQEAWEREQERLRQAAAAAAAASSSSSGSSNSSNNRR